MVVPLIVILVRLPLVPCSQVICSCVSTWLLAVLFWNVTTIVFPLNTLPPATSVAGVAVGVGVGVGVGDAVAVGVGVPAGPPGMVMNAHPWPESPPAWFWSPS